MLLEQLTSEQRKALFAKLRKWGNRIRRINSKDRPLVKNAFSLLILKHPNLDRPDRVNKAFTNFVNRKRKTQVLSRDLYHST